MWTGFLIFILHSFTSFYLRLLCAIHVLGLKFTKVAENLTQIADRFGIHFNLTFHIARHTFATTVTLSNGVPIETLSEMLGHRNLKTTQHYAKILDKKISDDMKRLKDYRF